MIFQYILKVGWLCDMFWAKLGFQKSIFFKPLKKNVIDNATLMWQAVGGPVFGKKFKSSSYGKKSILRRICIDLI